jgi:diguanylate cyclase (GGDEF)-like protein
MREGWSRVEERWRILLLPSFIAALLPFLLLWLPPARWHVGLVLAAGALTLAIVVIALRAPWGRLPAWCPFLLTVACLAVVALLRAAGGPSGVAPMVLLPVFWLGLSGTPRQLWCLLAGVGLVFVVPLILVGGADYPASAWRAGILFIALAGIVGTTIQSLVSRVRDHERAQHQLLDQLDELAHTDTLTGLRNRRAWEAELMRGLARARRTGEPVSVALVDIDSFKAVNDAYGHPGGDSLLIEVAHTWLDVLRPDDVLARIGGDEFAVLMPACTQADASDVIERLHERMPSPYSCSAGLATWDRAELPDRLMARADDALYEVKRAGRAVGDAVAVLS